MQITTKKNQLTFTTMVKNAKYWSMISEVKDMTDNNDHTGALIAVSSFFGLSRFSMVFLAIKTIQDIDGHIKDSLLAYRNEKADDLFSVITALHSKAIAYTIQKFF
jgi:hypothetical protein